MEAFREKGTRILSNGSLYVLRYGLVLIIGWFGAFKFTATEAAAIEPLLTNSPFVSWLYNITDVRGASMFIGSTELIIALLIAMRPVSARLSAFGSLAAIGMFATTLSFLFTTPGMWAQVDGLFVPSSTGAFVIKDLFLLGAAALTAAEALRAWSGAREPDRDHLANAVRSPA